MRNLNFAVFAGALVLAAPAQAHHDRGWEYARVVHAEPVYRQVRVTGPTEVCHEVPVTERTVYRRPHDPGAVLIGGIIGGVIGHQFGRGHRDGHLATAAGALIGANHAANHHAGRGQQVVERTVYETSCRTVRGTRWEERIDGYNVTYRHRGRLYETFTADHPGRYLRVRHDRTLVIDPYDDD